MKLLCAALLLFAFTLVAHAQQNDLLTQGFKRGDGDGDGRLSAPELDRIPRLKERVAGADKDGNGFITLEEFRAHLVSGAKPMPAQAPTPGSEGKLAAGDHTRAVTVGDLQRRYRTYVPVKYDAAKTTPVIIVFHGGGGNPESMVRLTGMNAKADEDGFIVVYPFGTGKLADSFLTFNGGGCCGYAMENMVDDVAFTRALLDDLATVVNVDTNRVFATGLSNGGIMAHYVAAHLSDRIAAIAPVGGPLMMDTIQPKRPVPVMHLHGTGDEFAPFNGGYGKGSFGRSKGVTDFKSVEHTVQSWIKSNGCQTEPKIEPLPDQADDGMKSTRKTWSGGKDGSEVVLIEIENGGHTWPGQKPIVALLGQSTMDFSANDLMWEFFQKHPMKPPASTKAEPKP